MKLPSVPSVAASAFGICLSFLATSWVSQAATFNQEAVPQERFTAIAVPLAQGNRHTLLVLEQVSETRQCWAENEDNPGVIEPLLLQFDFAGICGRSTDSNGYSIRVAGEDKALDYRLSIEKRNSQLVLVGVPLRHPRAPKLEIGRTETLASGFLKLTLDPGWQFAKRSYQGKVLGHVYLARETMPTVADQAMIAAAPLPIAATSSSAPSKLPDRQDAAVTPPQSSSVSKSLNKSASKPLTKGAPQPAPTASSSPVSATAIPTAGMAQGVPLTPPPSSPAKNSPKVVGTLGAGTIPSQPVATSTLKPITAPIEITVPFPSSTTTGSSPLAPAQAYASSAPPAPNTHNLDLPTLTPGLLAVPSAPVPLGRTGNEPDLISAQNAELNETTTAFGVDEPPAPHFKIAMSRPAQFPFRVFVNAADTERQSQVKSIVPDAFRSSYRGQSVLQVGAFQERSKADEMVNLLRSRGIDSILDAESGQ